MLIKEVDIAIVGGGPAGLAAAVKASELGTKEVLLIERDTELGGILNQCIHDGFGLIRFKKQLSGCEYAQRFVNLVKDSLIKVMCNSMVLEINKNKEIYVASKEHGFQIIKAKAIILSMGCRERTRSQVSIMGSRPSGVMSAGAVQKYINIDGYKPGNKAVILGSGDIGLIMARRMTLEGMQVEGVYEVMQNPGGLKRNIAQCLNDYDIPLHLSTTVTKVHGKKHIEGVSVAKVDENRKIIEETTRYIPCDLLVLSVGLIPENELSKNAGIELDKVTKGPIIDDKNMTSIEGIFAAGNVVAVFDLVDYVSKSGENAAYGAVDYIENNYTENKKVDVECGENINFIIPQNIEVDKKDKSIDLFMRVKKSQDKVKVVVKCDDKVIKEERHQVICPQEMIHVKFDVDDKLNENIKVEIVKG